MIPEKTPKFSFCTQEYNVNQLYLIKTHSLILAPLVTAHNGTKKY